jgi:serine/threonine protein kinase
MKQITTQIEVAKIGGYQILEKIGKGGMATVYKAADPFTGQLLAIKVLPASVTEHPVLRMRFAQECQVARNLRHPNIVRVLEFGLEGSRPFLVMEYVDGESLGQRLEQRGRLPEDEAVRLISQIGGALDWAHGRKLIHRDVKPDNILITVDGQAKLSDLGLVKNLDGEFNLTMTQSCLGTPNFMAPEQFQDSKRVDTLSDLYSLAATLYMTVTGELPFRASNERALLTMLKMKLANEIAAPRQLAPELSERLDGAVMRGLRADPKERQASILDFLQSLKEETVPVATIAMSGPSAKESEQGRGRRRRGHKRYDSRRATSCQAMQRTADKHWEGQVVNISQTGLCVELNRRYQPGAILKIVLESENIKRQTLLVQVVWVTQQSPNCWHMGCQFDQPLCEFEIQYLR